MNKYKINIIYNNSDLSINDLIINTLKREISKNLNNIILKRYQNNQSLNKTNLSHRKCS